MADSINPPSPPASSDSSAAHRQLPKKRRKWVRRLLFIVGGLVVVVAVLVALGPSIASTGAVRSAVLSRVNQGYLSGKVEIADWSFGWFSAQTIRGIKVYDDKQTLVAEVPSVTVDKSLASAVSDAFAFGKVRVERPNLNVRKHTDGSLNVATIVKSDGSEKKTETPIDLSKPIDIPNVIGEIEIVDGTASFSGEPGLPAVAVSRLNGTIKFPGGDAPVTNSFDLTTFVGDGGGGQVKLDGTIGVVKNGQLVINSTNARQDLTVTDIPVDVVQAFLPPELLNKVTGRANGSATFAVVDGKQATVSGKFTIAKLSASGPVLKGDTLSAESTELALPTITVAMPNGPTDVTAMRVTTGTGPTQPITLALDQGKATVFIDAPLGAVLKILDGQAPGETGTAVVTANFDAGKIVPQLTNTLKLVDGVSLIGGKLASTTTINLTPASVALTSSTALTDVAGRNTVKNTAIALKPIKIDVAASTADVTNPLVSLRDVKLDLASGFANGSFSGPTLAGLNGQLDGTLEAVQTEAGQVIDFGTTKLAGAFKATVETSGDLSKTLTEPAVLTAGLSVTNLNVSGVGAEPISEPQIAGNLRAEILTGEDGLPVSIDVTQAKLDAGNAGALTVAADATVKIVRKGQAVDVPSFAVSKFALNLPRAINLAGVVVPAARQYGKGLTGEVRATLSGSAFDLLGSPKLSLPAFEVAHSEDLIGAKVVEPLNVSLPAGAALPQGTGKLQWSVDLAKLNPVVRNVLAESASAVDVRSGRVSGALAFARDPGATATSVVVDGETTTINLASKDGQAQIAPLTFGVTAKAADDLSAFSVDRAVARGEVLTADAKLNGTKTRDRIDITSFDVADFKADTGKLGALAQAFVPADYRKYATALPGTITAKLAGKATDVTASPAVELTTLSTDHSAGLFNANIDKPFSVALVKGSGVPQVNGTLNARLDLPHVNRLLRGMMGMELTAKDAAGDVKSGMLAGTLAFSRPNETHAGVIADFALTNLTVTSESGTTNFQPLKLSLDAATADDLSSVNVKSASATGDLLNASLANALVKLKDPADPTAKTDPLKMVESAEASLSIPNLQPLYAIASGFMPAAPVAPLKPGEEAVEPLAVTGGSFSTKVTVTRGADGLPNVNVSEIAGKNIRATMGGSAYEVASIAGSQTVTPAAGGKRLSPQGKVTINGVRMKDKAGTVLFAEDAVEIANDLSVDIEKMDAVINAFSLNTTSSGAVALSVKGAVRDLMAARRFDNVVADVTYDPAPLAQLAKPFIAAEPDSLLADLSASAGKVTRQWLIGGSLPADKPFNESIRSLTASGGVALPSATVQGNTVADVDLNVSLANGVATIASPKLARFNGGELNLDGTTVDLTDPFAPRLSMPKGQQLVKGAAINPYLVNNTLGQVNPLFAKALTAEGTLNATVTEFSRVPLGALLTQTAAQNDGVAEIGFDIKDMKLGNPFVSTILQALGNRPTLDGEVRPSSVTLGGGVAKTNVTYSAVQGDRAYPLRIAGDVGLTSFNINQMSMTVLTEFVQGRGGDIAKYMPAELVVPVTGAVDSPSVDFAGVLQRNLVEAGKKAAEQGLKDKLLKGTDLGKLLGGKDQKKVADEVKAGAKPDDAKAKQEETAEEAVEDALKGLFNRKKKDKK